MPFRIISTFLLLSSFALAQTPTANEVKSLFEAQKYEEVLAATGASTVLDADSELYKGFSLARLQRFEEAKQTFLRAQQRYRNDSRFPVELAGLAFQSHDYAEASQYLERALRLNPSDSYAINFLASVYLLRGNLDAAIKYWNRISQPNLDQIRFEPELQTNPILLDRTLKISPRSTLNFDDLKTSQSRIESLRVFSNPQYKLQAKPDGTFDFIIRGAERKGFGNSKPQALLRVLRGLPYQTLYPEYYNLGGNAINITSLLRWDSNKRRGSLNISAPFRNQPSLHYRIFADVRDENWILSPDTASALDFHSRQFAVGAALDQYISGKWNWGMSSALVHESAPAFSDVFTRGYSLQYSAHVQRQLLYVPEKRLNVSARLTPSFGRNFADQSSSFAQLKAVTDLNWQPGDTAGDYEISARITGSRSWGTLPFGQLAMLGVERDSDLLLRGHPGTRDGRKGSAPLARDFLLGNLEFSRRIYNNGLVDLRLGPFVDVVRPWRTLQTTGVPAWLVDPGVAITIRILGSASVTFSYGRNLHDRRNAFYFSALN